MIFLLRFSARKALLHPYHRDAHATHSTIAKVICAGTLQKYFIFVHNSKGVHYIYQELLYSNKSGRHRPAIHHSPWRHGCHFLQNDLACFNYFLAPYNTRHRTVNMISTYLHRWRQCFMKPCGVFLEPTNILLFGRYKHSFAVAKVAVQVSGSSSPTFQTLHAMSIMHFTDFYSDLGNIFSSELSLYVLNARFLWEIQGTSSSCSLTTGDC